MKANYSNQKLDNIFIPLSDFNKLRLAKSAVVYGANASGKTNLIRLMWTLQDFILNSIALKAGDKIYERFYDPFLLDTASVNEATEITINFIPKNKKRHKYIIKYNNDEVLYEYLGIYETNRISKIFERKNANEFVEFGEAMQNKKEDKRVVKNNLFLSKFGNIPNNQIRDIYLYFKEIEIWNIPATHHTNGLYHKIQNIFNNPIKYELSRKISKLINVADTKIIEVLVSEKPEKDFEYIPEDIRKQIINSLRFETFGVHNTFDYGNISGIQSLSFDWQESQGTRAIFAIGGLILEAFEKEYPVLIFLDEFNNSLHPNLASFLIELFHNPKINKNNSQFIFATHDTTLLNKKLFRKDQIWFTSKNKYGSTELYSADDFKNLKDFDKVNSDISFDKWYTTGKFGAIPNIKKFEFIAECCI